jgi:hypothetical protein
VSDQVDTLLPKEFVLANSEAEVAAAPVEDDNDNDKTNQELMDELAAEEDWMEPNRSNPMSRLGGIIRDVFGQADEVETPTGPQLYEAVTIFDVEEVEEEFSLRHPSSQDTLVSTEEDAGVGDYMILSSRSQHHEESTLGNAEEDAREGNRLLLSSERENALINIGEVAAEDNDVPRQFNRQVPLIHIHEAEGDDPPSSIWTRPPARLIVGFFILTKIATLKRFVPALRKPGTTLALKGADRTTSSTWTTKPPARENELAAEED